MLKVSFPPPAGVPLQSRQGGDRVGRVAQLAADPDAVGNRAAGRAPQARHPSGEGAERRRQKPAGRTPFQMRPSSVQGPGSQWNY